MATRSRGTSAGASKTTQRNPRRGTPAPPFTGSILNDEQRTESLSEATGARGNRSSPDTQHSQPADVTHTTLERRGIPSFSDSRAARIAEAAYWRAERRGFAPGQELDDWLAAERQIDR